MLVPAKKLPDLNYPHYKKWYNTKSWLSSDASIYQGFATRAGQHMSPCEPIIRGWGSSTTPTRASVDYSSSSITAIDLTTPCYMLAGTSVSDLVGDALVGLDYYNPPLLMAQDIIALGASRETYDATTPLGALFGRVLAINHTFTFVNYSRFPLEIFYAVLPYQAPYVNIESLTQPHEDLQNSQYRKIVVRGVRDAGDRGAKRDVKITANLQQIFPDAYDMPPAMHGGNVVAEAGEGPWFSCRDGTGGTVSMFGTVPPGQSLLAVNPHTVSEAPAVYPPALSCRIYTKLQMPYNLGTTVWETAPDGGDMTINSYTVHTDMSWLVEYINTSSKNNVHPGEEAYPNQTA